ncbi:thioredoxin reductase [Subtercola boreus]|uniref:Thioredoxin reductase n=1 Tax=Subtercola boreus TaxID=120213 RepID=A0A3E0VN77_9MICO|nr:NAD(P)/FAD-dependent oxidoreductase [Subtercola boreus]RFA11171.1 thioredoxin reductase [Subtercola boreus]TQL53731.1 thioredoxin reductase [Subtercola boreus]
MTNRPAADEARETPGRDGSETVWDAVVVGGGAAGLSAALSLGRARRSVLVIDAGQPRNAPAEGVHVFLTRDGTPPAELARLGRLDVQKYGGVVRPGTVVSVRRLPGEPLGPAARFAVTLGDGTEVLARRLVFSTGAVDELPDVPGLRAQWGRGIIHCPYCHGWEVRDQRIGVLGTGPRAVFQALLFRQWSDRITLLLHDAPEPTPEEREQLAARGIEVVTGRVVRVLSDSGSGSLTGAELAGGHVVPLAAIAVATRIVVSDAMLVPLGAAVAEHPSGAGTFAVADEFGRAADGVWVAGNLANPMAQVITAAASGVMAGAAVNADLLMEDTAAAVAARRA